MLLRQRVNDAFKATLLGLAEGTDLDNLADFYDVARAAGETDVALRSRVIERIEIALQAVRLGIATRR